MKNQQLEAQFLSEKITERMSDFIDYLDIYVEEFCDYYSGPCPIHGGDNKHAFSFYKNGNWRCFTKRCHEKYKGSPLGLLRGVLSAKNDVNMWPWNKTIQSAKDFVGDVNIDYAALDRRKFINLMPIIEDKMQTKFIKKDQLKGKIKNCPSPYYIKRGFCPSILEKYQVGECRFREKKMYMRAVFPVFCENYEYLVGCTGRSLYDTFLPKWLHVGFASGSYLFNYWFAKHEIKKTRTAILVESPGNVLKLECAGVKNSVGLFGTEFTQSKQLLLEKLGVMNIITIFDNDQAGEDAEEKINNECSKYFNIKNLKPTRQDVGEMDICDIRRLLNLS